MKPCAKNQKVLSLLAINALEHRPGEELRAHLDTCPGCRRYFEEMSSVVGKLTASSATSSEIEASEMFHRRLTRRIEVEGKPSVRAALWTFVRSGELSWRVVVPVAGVVMGVLIAMIALGPQRGRQSVMQVIGPIASATKPVGDLAPTFGSYRMLANRSLDALDQELTKEAESGPAEAPVYTMSSMARAIAAD